jgi:hypothetical protein
MGAPVEEEFEVERFTSKISQFSVGSCASDFPSRRASRDCVLQQGPGGTPVNLHISGRPAIEVILGKPGQKMLPEEANQVAVYHAAASLMKALTDAGVATIRTNFRGRNQVSPDPRLSLFGPMPGLDIAGDYRVHWSDFSNTWESCGVGTMEILEALQSVDRILVGRMSNAKGLQEAWESVEDMNDRIFKRKNISINFHVLKYTSTAGITGLFSKSTVFEGNTFFLSVTPWDENGAFFPREVWDNQVNVSLKGSKCTWKLAELYEGQITRTKSGSKEGKA